MLLLDTVFSAPATQTPSQLDRLMPRICVRPPYFALRDLRSEENVLWATATAELPEGLEHGPMQGAELSRHAAIAGLSVAALAQPDDQRRYYLAQQATFEGYPSDAPYGSEITLRAELLELGKRAVRSRIEAFVNGHVIAVVEVLYTVLTDSAFSRLFRSRERPLFGAEHHEAMPALPAGVTRQNGARWSRHVAAVPEEACAGHFERYPAMPVAILMGQLSQLAGQALGPGQPYAVARAQVDARDFCWAGESATFEVEPTDGDVQHTVFECQVSTPDRTVGQMQLSLYRR